MAYVSQSPEYDQVTGLLQRALEVDALVHQWSQSQVDACLEDISNNVMLVPSRKNGGRKKSQRQHQQSCYDSVPATIVETDAGNLILKRDMSDEMERYMTFLQKNWPRNVPVLFSKLADAGFFNTRVHDTIECIGCKGRISNWGNGETVMKVHNRLHPHCKFARGSDRRNVPYHGLVNESQEGTEGTLKGQSGTLLFLSNDVSGSEDESYRFGRGRPINLSQLDSLSEPTGFITKYSKCPEMVMEGARLETYRQWPGGRCQIPENLARAGFFAIGKDQVKCFSCGYEVQDWGKDDDPWLIHARLSTRCAWLQQQRGPSFGNPRDQTSTWQPAPFPSGVLYSEDRTQSMPSLVTSELETKSRDEFRREKGDIQMKKPTEQVEKKNQKIKEAKLLQEREKYVQQHMSDSGQAEEIVIRTEVMKGTQTRKRPYDNSEGLQTAMLDEKAAEKYTEAECALPGNLEGATRPPEDGHICWELPTEDRNETSSEKNTVKGPEAYPNFKDVLMKLAEYFTKADIDRLCDLFDFSSSKKNRILGNPEPAKTFLLHLWREEIIKSDDIVSLHDALTQLKMLQANKILKELHRGMKQPHEDMMAEEMEKLREKYLCKICCHKIVKIVFLPCLHLLCCDVCSFRLEKCPVCRKIIFDRISVIFHDLLKP